MYNVVNVSILMVLKDIRDFGYYGNYKFKVWNILYILSIVFVYSKIGLNSKYWGVFFFLDINIKLR